MWRIALGTLKSIEEKSSNIIFVCYISHQKAIPNTNDQVLLDILARNNEFAHHHLEAGKWTIQNQCCYGRIPMPMPQDDPKCTQCDQFTSCYPSKSLRLEIVLMNVVLMKLIHFGWKPPKRLQNSVLFFNFSQTLDLLNTSLTPKS